MKIQRTAALPPFYTHGIGSLPRPKAVRELLGRRAELGEERFGRMMDEMIVFANRVVEGLKAEVHLHCCHSVYKRQSDVTGDYKPILPRLGEAKIDRVNLEFAYHGTGQLDDLKLLPAHLGVGVGVVDVRREKLQEVEEMQGLAREAARIVGKQRVALNPDCGFAPDAGEPPSIDEAFEKLKRMCQAAAALRGE